MIRELVARLLGLLAAASLLVALLMLMGCERKTVGIVEKVLVCTNEQCRVELNRSVDEPRQRVTVYAPVAPGDLVYRCRRFRNLYCVR